ncbi:hypothetical protein [Leucobacter sp. wl10]|uniref:hypothetical protein n=1 Tax=Leucobacter sp. wl10 TaxID=2304677 RepID=UPI000E5A5BDA|nr:hypothetical protein [Leucobacter sp. wl10]RGE21584.1 hypothetical protein D1J51_07085 [Leucobacter sp. wl10]
MSTDHDELAARAERGDLTVKPGTVRRGAEGTAEAQRLLTEATGATNADELAHRFNALQASRIGVTPLEELAS